MEGVDIFQKNRSKCGIRGTWQARIRFKDVKVPRENLLHKEGKGLNVALSCLNYGRCTLSAGMLGGARRARERGTRRLHAVSRTFVMLWILFVGLVAGFIARLLSPGP